MNLVVHHVLEALVVGGAQEDLRVELAASETVVQDLVAALVVAVLTQQVRDLLHVHCVVEGSGISDLTFVGRHLRGKLNQLRYTITHACTHNGRKTTK